MFSSNTSQVADGGYQIQRSLRFNSPDSADLRRTPASAGNRKTWTWSAWVKRGSFPANASLFGSAPTGTSYTWITLFSNNLVLENYDGALAGVLTTTAVFRDPSAWYHIVAAWDSTQATSSNRIRLYVNGVQMTAFSTASYPSQNLDSVLNNANQHAIGSLAASYTSGYYFDGYMAEVYFIDGQALTPSSFGETNAQTGVWQPKAYAGSYGTNGYYLNFSDNSNTTAATLGKDYSGNGNNWTPNNFSVTAGAGNDSLVDTPTPYGSDSGAGGEVRGNYSALNPLDNGGLTITNGNLDTSRASSSWVSSRATFGMSSGKWYWEFTATSAVDSNNDHMLGLMRSLAAISNYPGADANGWGYLSFGGNKFTSGSGSSYGAGWTNGDVIGVAFDADAGTLTFYKNNTSQGTAYTGLTSGPYFPALGLFGTASGSFNFGQRPFAYTAPSGFKALCTQNLPTPTIGATTATQAGKYFDVVLRNGGGSSGGTYSTTVDMSSGALLWDKPRNSASSNYLVDSVRGISKNLRSNVTNAEATDASWFTNFGSTSFTTGSSDWGTGTTVVDWIWAANGSGSTNTAGSITSTVSANTTSGFSIVTYTGNGVSGATVGHGLGVTPSMIILKSRTDGVYDWRVYHSALTAGYNIALNSTAQQYQGSTGNAGFISAVSSTTYTLTQSGADVLAAVNKNGDNYVAYCFAAVPGFSAFGSYTGNGSTDGPFVFCGFRPRWIMYKDASATNPWVIVDTTRQNYNVLGPYLLANASDAENTFPILDALSNGFKVRFGGPSSVNTSGNTIVFAAFAQFPFKYALAL